MQFTAKGKVKSIRETTRPMEVLEDQARMNRNSRMTASKAFSPQRWFIVGAVLNIGILLFWNMFLWLPNERGTQTAQPLRIVLLEITNSSWGPALVFELTNTSRDGIAICSFELEVGADGAPIGLPRPEPGARPIFYGEIHMSERPMLKPGAGYIQVIHAPYLRRYKTPAHLAVTTVRSPANTLIEEWRFNAVRWLRREGFQTAARRVRPERVEFVRSISGPISASAETGTESILKEKR